MLSESIHLPKSIKDAENRFLVVLKEQLLKIIKEINKIEKITKITPKVNTTNVTQLGNYYYCYRCGIVVTLGLNIQVKASVASGQTLLSELPTPPAKIGCILGSASVPLRCYIDIDGKLKLDGASPSSAQWFNGCITYITNS